MNDNGHDQKWTVNEAKNQYGIHNWGNNYFDINDKGELAVNNPLASNADALPLINVIEGLRDRELQMPVLLRIENILDQSIKNINDVINRSINCINLLCFL